MVRTASPKEIHETHFFELARRGCMAGFLQHGTLGELHANISCMPTCDERTTSTRCTRSQVPSLTCTVDTVRLTALGWERCSGPQQVGGSHGYTQTPCYNGGCAADHGPATY